MNDSEIEIEQIKNFATLTDVVRKISEQSHERDTALEAEVRYLRIALRQIASISVAILRMTEESDRDAWGKHLEEVIETMRELKGVLDANRAIGKTPPEWVSDTGEPSDE